MSGNESGPRPMWQLESTSSYQWTDMAPPRDDATHDFAATPAANGETDGTSVEDIKALIQDRLSKEHSGANVYKGYISSAADYRNKYQEYVSLSSRPAAFCLDFPDHDSGLTKLAKRLYDAMLDFDNAVEAGQKSVTRIQQLSPFEVELKSWELLFVLRDVQLGQVGLPIWGKVWTGEDFDSFMGRYNDTVSKLRDSKSMVSSLFDEAFTVRLALAPAAELKKKLANMNNNARRAVELAMVRGEKQKKQKKSTEASDHASENVEDTPGRMAAHHPGTKRLRPEDHSPDDSQLVDEILPNKRPRVANSYAASKEKGSEQNRFTSHGGHDNDTRGSFAHGTRNLSLHSGLSEFFETPSLTPASELTDNSSLVSDRGYPNERNCAQAPFEVCNPKTNAPQAFSSDHDAIALDTDAFHLPNEAFASDDNWSMNGFPNNALMLNGHDNNSAAAFSFNPRLEYRSDFLYGATGPHTTQEPNENGANLSFDFEQTHGIPADTGLGDEDGRVSEAVTLTPGDNNDPIVHKQTVDVDKSVVDAIVNDDLWTLDPNAIGTFYDEDGTFDTLS